MASVIKSVEINLPFDFATFAASNAHAAAGILPSEYHELMASLMDRPDPIAPKSEDPDLNQYMRRWRQFECDKIQADIYRAQERR